MKRYIYIITVALLCILPTSCYDPLKRVSVTYLSGYNLENEEQYYIYIYKDDMKNKFILYKIKLQHEPGGTIKIAIDDVDSINLYKIVIVNALEYDQFSINNNIIYDKCGSATINYDLIQFLLDTDIIAAIYDAKDLKIEKIKALGRYDCPRHFLAADPP